MVPLVGTEPHISSLGESADITTLIFESKQPCSGAGFERVLHRNPIEYFQRFYGDTVTSGSTAALMCGYSFFGADHILFGTDMPYDEELGLRGIRDTVRAIEQMEISEAERVKIFEGNARTLLRLPI